MSSKSFDQQLKDGDIFDVTEAARRSGYNAVYLRRLCKAEKIDHTRRGIRIFFTRDQVHALFNPMRAA